MLATMKLSRVFEINGTRIDDPMPDATLDESVRQLSQTYPQFRHTKVYEEDGVVEESNLIFKLELPPPKTNG